ncbi:MAG: MgtC/SapB family protein [Clostridia bacterium]|jgi:putative Mg2+ transporter-C (MgtC) family protein|nr:MgtC/SapB family protein [Clostridia bacterium]
MWEVNSILSVSGFLIHLLVASALGYAIGFERQWTKHQAGTVTSMMVVVGSFAFTAFAFLLADAGNADLTRIPGQIVTGIGFLGAGVILKEGGTVRGLTTAATIWAAAAVGILACLDNMLFAVAVAGALVLLHLFFHPLSVWIDKNRRHAKTRYDHDDDDTDE